MLRIRPAPFAWLADEFTPGLNGVSALGEFAQLCALELAARQRGTLLLLAIASYRVGHHELPLSLDELAGQEIDPVPRDPYSGRAFVYFPHGLPEPNTDLEAQQLKQAQRTLASRNELVTPLEPGVPCVWCTGPFLKAYPYHLVGPESEDDDSPDQSEADTAKRPIFYALRTDGRQRVSRTNADVHRLGARILVPHSAGRRIGQRCSAHAAIVMTGRLSVLSQRTLPAAAAARLATAWPYPPPKPDEHEANA